MAGGPERDHSHEAELEEQIVELMEEVDRYRTACEDTLQQLDWCIGYFTGCNKRGVARALSANRSAIRRHLLGRPEMATPETHQETAS
ncbi:MAG: hypothetical protein J7518_04745 [Nocardioidaceae bacterium]|nr:hypothetical protein [Nocardioidaceae bacterium]